MTPNITSFISTQRLAMLLFWLFSIFQYIWKCQDGSWQKLRNCLNL